MIYCSDSSWNSRDVDERFSPTEVELLWPKPLRYLKTALEMQNGDSVSFDALVSGVDEP